MAKLESVENVGVMVRNLKNAKKPLCPVKRSHRRCTLLFLPHHPRSRRKNPRKILVCQLGGTMAGKLSRPRLSQRRRS